VEIDESKIQVKARRVLRVEVSKKLEKGWVKKVMPKDDNGAAREALQLEKKLGIWHRWGQLNYLMLSRLHKRSVKRGAGFWAAKELCGV